MIIITILSVLTVFMTILSAILWKRNVGFKLQNALLNNDIEYKNNEIAKYQSTVQHMEIEFDTTRNAYKDLEILLARQEEKYNEMIKNINNWENTQTKILEYSKSAMFEVGNKLSHHLISEHRRENEETNKKSEEKLNDVTLKLFTQFQNIITSVEVLNEQVKHSKETVDVVKQALLSPSKVGALSEITLGNILKSSALTEGRDYVMQTALMGAEEKSARLRPDVLVFLPNNSALIIDSKASIFFLDINHNDEEIRKQARQNLKTSMHKHMKSLSSKDYHKAAFDHLDKTHKGQYKYLSVLMFLPTDAAIQTIQEIDHEFISKAWEHKVFPVGPSSLIHLLSYTRFHISSFEQSKNQELIIEELRKLMVGIINTYEHSNRLGKNLQHAVQSYDKFASSFNSGILQRAKHMNKLGVDVNQQKQLPTSTLTRLQTISSGNSNDEEESAS